MLGTLARLALATSLLLAGCKADDDDTGSADDDVAGDDDTTEDVTGDDDSTECRQIEIAANGLFPPPGESYAYHRTPVIATFTIPAESATLELEIADTGDPVDGTLETTPDDTQVVFQPMTPLSLATLFRATVHAVGGEDRDELTETWEFTTSSTGTPLEHPQIVVDQAWRIDMNHLRSVQPALPTLVSGELAGAAVLGVVSFEPASGEVKAIATPIDPLSGEVDYCLESREFPMAPFAPTEDPYLELGPTETLSFPVEGFDIQVHDARIRGSVVPDGTTFDGARLTGMLDTSGLSQLLDDWGGPCHILETEAAVPCEACPDDGAEACISIDLVELSGEGLPAPLHKINADQTENHLCGNCEDGTDNDGDGQIDGDEPECYPAVWP